jgi:GT2 family glycosyltransferase
MKNEEYSANEGDVGYAEHTGDSLPTPKITVITSLYKAGEHIDLFLNDIKNQTIFNEIDWHFINADSPDGEHEKLLEFQKEYKNIRISKELTRIGLYKAWNKGVRRARAKYVGNLNVDDKLRYDYYERMVNYLDKNKGCDIVYSNILVSHDPEEIFYDVNAKKSVNRLASSSFCDLHSSSILGAVHNCPVWRKSIHEEIGGFDESFSVAGDTEFWIRAQIAGKKIEKIYDFMALYYVNPKGISTPWAYADKDNTGADFIVEKEDNIIWNKYKDVINLHGLQNFYNYLDSQR